MAAEGNGAGMVVAKEVWVGMVAKANGTDWYGDGITG